MGTGRGQGSGWGGRIKGWQVAPALGRPWRLGLRGRRRQAGVLGTGVEIGGVSPVLEPWQGESNTGEARARPGSDRAACRRPVALAGFREGGSESGYRCVVVANESEAP